MKYFSFKAVDESGLVRRGSMAAMNAADLDARLADTQLELISYRQSFIATLRRNIGGKQSWTRRELVDFTFHLEQLLSAGVPLLEALCEYRDSAEKGHLSSVVGQLADAINSGSRLSQACSAQAHVFNKMFVSMIEVGEQSGNLDRVLADLGQLLKWHDETLSRIRSVLIYPTFVAVVLLLVIIFVMTWLVPGLMSFVVSTGNELPWHTKVLISTSSIVSEYWLILVAGCFALVLLMRLAIATSTPVKTRWDALLLEVPLFGPVLFRIKLARFSRCASLMYASGISLLDTLELGEGVVDNLQLSNSLGDIRRRIIDGQTVSESFASSRVFPPMFARMMRIGENTGAMDSAFNQTGYFYDRESRESIEKLEQFIGPAMIIVVGSIMMWVVISVIGPIYDLVFSMSGQF